MRIALLIDSLGSGGAQRQIVNLAIELKRRGHCVDLVYYHQDEFHMATLLKADISPILVSNSGAISRLVGIRKQLKALNPEIVIAYLNTPGFCASVASLGKHNWKLIVSERNANRDAFLNKKSNLMKYVQAKVADQIVCNSWSARKLWEEFFPNASQKIETIYNIIDVPQIELSNHRESKCKIVVPARYDSEKNLDGLLQALLLLSEEERQALEIHWYGRNRVGDEIVEVYRKGIDYINEHGLQHCISLNSETNMIYPIMAEADFVALFSHREGLPNAIIEGMTLKKPVVMSKVSDYAVLVNEENGFLCNPNSSEDIARALRGAISTSPAQRTEMGNKSYEKIKTICSRDVVISQWEDILHN